jgi:hypothetical protein
MTHGPEHHIEHAEHAAHAAHDDFNKRVTMSIAIVAAVLACVTMLGHRAHNTTLLLQGQALELQTKASKMSTDVANEWAYYQSKNTFNLESEIFLDTLKIVTVRDDRKKELDEILKRYEDTVEYYSGDKESRVTARKRKSKTGSAEEEKKTGKLFAIEEKARKKAEEVTKTEEAAEAKIKESHLVHEKASRFDYGELGLQFGVVLCSLAILTRSRGFWLAGLVAAVIGALVALTGLLGLFIEHH